MGCSVGLTFRNLDWNACVPGGRAHNTNVRTTKGASITSFKDGHMEQQDFFTHVYGVKFRLAKIAPYMVP